MEKKKAIFEVEETCTNLTPKIVILIIVKVTTTTLKKKLNLMS